MSPTPSVTESISGITSILLISKTPGVTPEESFHKHVVEAIVAVAILTVVGIICIVLLILILVRKRKMYSAPNKVEHSDPVLSNPGL